MNEPEDHSADPAEGTATEEIEVEGEKVSKAELARIVKDYRNDTSWKASNTQSAQQLAAERAAFAAERQAHAEERARAAREADPKPPDELAELEKELEISTEGLPSPVDDEDGFKKGMAARTSQALAKVARKTLEIAGNKAAQATQEATRAASATADLKGIQASIVAANEATAAQYFKDHPEITTTEQAKIRNRLVRDPEFGTEDPTTRFFKFNNAGFESADRSVRKSYWDAKAKEAGFNEGLSQREKAARAGEHVGGGGTGRAPASNAPIRDIANHITSLSPVAHGRYMDSLPKDKIDELIKFQFQEELELAGQ